MGKAPCVILSALIILHSASAARATNGLEPVNTSMKARARGGADVAVGDTALSQIHNPASLSLRSREKVTFDFSGQLLFTRLHWDGPVDDARSNGVFPLANLGVAFPLDKRWTLGLALQSKSGMGSSYRSRHLLIPFWKRDVGSDVKNMSLSLNLAHQLTDRLSVGVGVRGEAATAEFSAVLGPADIDFERGYAYGVGLDVGVLYQATDDLAFGVAYRSPTWFGDLDGGDLTASLGGFLPVGLGAGRIEDFRLPQQVSAGVSWDANEWLKLVGEVRWTDYPSSSFGSMMVGMDGLLNVSMPFPASYKEQWVFIAGAEIKLDENWIWGLGYNYSNNVVPESNVLPIAPANLQHHFTTGIRYETDGWWAGAGYIYGFNSRTSANGRTDVPLGIDFAYSEIDHEQHSLFFGFGFEF